VGYQITQFHLLATWGSTRTSPTLPAKRPPWMRRSPSRTIQIWMLASPVAVMGTLHLGSPREGAGGNGSRASPIYHPRNKNFCHFVSFWRHDLNASDLLPARQCARTFSRKPIYSPRATMAFTSCSLSDCIVHRIFTFSPTL
jgi:hypothetical protein